MKREHTNLIHCYGNNLIQAWRSGMGHSVGVPSIISARLWWSGTGLSPFHLQMQSSFPWLVFLQELILETAPPTPPEKPASHIEYLSLSPGSTPRSSFLLMCPVAAAKMAEIIGFLPHMRETQNGLWIPYLSWPKTQLFQGFKKWTNRWKISLFLTLCLSN